MKNNKWYKPLALAMSVGMSMSYMPLSVSAAEPAPDKSSAPSYVKDSTDYKLVWNDEFDGTAINTNDWNIEAHEPKWVNDELQRYVGAGDMQDNIKVEDGVLKLIPKATKKEEQGSSNPDVLDNKSFDGTWSGPGATVANGKATIVIDDVKANPWDVQFQKAGMTLTKGHQYKLSFKAKSTVARSIAVNFANTEDYSTPLASQEFAIGTEESEYTLEFEMGKCNAGKAAIQMNLGNLGEGKSAPSTLELSSISLLDLSEDVDIKSAYDYTSGRVNTQNKHDFTYGYFEARARVPQGQGYLPAFWLMASDEDVYGQWPRCGEMDIMEVMGQSTNHSHHNVHYGYNDKEGHSHYECETFTAEGQKDFSEDYHVFGLDWEPGLITWYVDGKVAGSTNDWFAGKDETSQLTYPAPFDQNFYVILNLAVGGEWVGYPNQEVVDDMANQSYDIDYVRVYQKDAATYAKMEEEVQAPSHEVVYKTADKDGNYITNGNFATDHLKAMNSEGDNFELHLEKDCKEGTTYKITDGVLKISQDNIGEQNHSVQLKQTGLPMIKGWEYEITFDAWADEDRNIIVDVEGPDRGWTRYYEDTKFNITTKRKTYSATFTMDKKNDANGSLEFNLGNQGSTAPVYISNIKLVHKSGEEVIEKFEKTITAEGNHIYNGSFEQGSDRLKYWQVEKGTKEAEVKVTNPMTGKGRKRELGVKVVVPEGATKLDPVIVSQNDIAPLAKGVYSFSFDSYSSDGVTDGMSVFVGGKKYKPALTKERKSYEYKVGFDKDLTDEESGVSFKFFKPGTYYLDNVVLIENTLIQNGSFTSGLAGYEYGYYQEASATFGVDSQKEGNETAFDADIKDTGTADWNIQLKQRGITLKKDSYYRLTFNAKSTVDRQISVVMQRDGSKDDKWDVYSGDNVINLTNTWTEKPFELKFQMTADTDTDALLSVSLGKFDERITDVHHVYLDNFYLEETDKDGNVISSVELSPEDNTEDKYDVPVTQKDEPSKNEPGKANPAKNTSKGKNNGDKKVQKGETAVTSAGTFTALNAKEAIFKPSKEAKSKKSVTIPATVVIDSKTVKVTQIAANAFAKDNKLTKVVIGKNVKKINASAFANCKKLTSVVFKGTSVATIGKNAFAGDVKLKGIDLSKQKNLSAIGAGAFKNCKAAKTIKLYANKNLKINSSTFSGVPNAKTTKVIIYAKSEKQYDKVVTLVKKNKLKKVTFSFKKVK